MPCPPNFFWNEAQKVKARTSDGGRMNEARNVARGFSIEGKIKLTDKFCKKFAPEQEEIFKLGVRWDNRFV